MAASRFLTQLNLSADQRLNPPPLIGKLKTIQEWASSAIDSVKDNVDFLTAIKEVSPWAEAAFSAAKDALAPVKFVVKVFEELTKIQDPEELARLACTIAYQSVAEKALVKAGAPANPATPDGAKFGEAEEIDFSNFTLTQVTTHAFVTRADRTMHICLRLAGFSPDQIDTVIRDIHTDLPGELETLLAHGKSKEKFDLLVRWLQLPSEGRLSRAALRRYSDYVSWVFNEAPVLQCEPYALADVRIEAECSKLTHRDFRDSGKPDQSRPNPFAEGDANGGRHPLLETVMGYVADPKFREAIVIQGSAGSGKSTFTLRLADHLRQEGLRPLRIRLRDVILGKEFYAQLGEALSYDDEVYLSSGRERFVPGPDPLQAGAIFQEELRYAGHANICPYVLILDGWDEISVAVSEGFKQRVKELLLHIRSELFRPGRPVVRVVLTGRPSDAIEECSEFFRDDTPVLTIRTLNPDQLPTYATKLREATELKRLTFQGVTDWTFPEGGDLAAIFTRYREEFGEEDRQANAVGGTQTGVAAVLGYPLLLHVTFRLLAEPGIDRKELIESPATLLRKLTDFATREADQPSDRQRGTKIQARVGGSELRVLLRRTAANMTALGQEGISKAELEKRLRVNDLPGHVKNASKDNLISALLVSFYFKGGNAALGCEFTHKAFREYLFAEEIVETLKSYARSGRSGLPERPPPLYWKDFDSSDPRRGASLDLATLLTPQWLSPEVVSYLGSLLDWEIRRTFSPVQGDWTGETAPASAEEWTRTRTLLADLWDWWADGVHVRPQPREDENTGQIDWERSLAERLVPRCRQLTPSGVPGSLSEPVRTATLDAHLGDALFRLCCWVHWYLRAHSDLPAPEAPRRFQGSVRGRIAFRPTGKNPEYFAILCHRISGAGWCPAGVFPSGVFARGIDLSETDLNSLRLLRADLEESSFERASIFDCAFFETNLAGCRFCSCTAHRNSFLFAVLDRSDFERARLQANVFRGASLHGALFRNEHMGGNYLSRLGLTAPIPDNDFTGARGMDPADPVSSEGHSAESRPRKRARIAKSGGK